MSSPSTPQKLHPGVTGIVLAAGMGTRMKSALPKAMHRVAGKPLVRHAVDGLESVGASRIVVVVSENMTRATEVVAPHPVAIQHERLGTGHAVAAAREALPDPLDTVLVLFGADLLFDPTILPAMIERRRAEDNPGAVILGFRAEDPGAYGRLIVDKKNALTAIVEAKEASAEELAINLCNGGAMAIAGDLLWGLIDRLDNDNAKGEYYLTDIVAHINADGGRCAVVEIDEADFLGVDSRSDLALAETAMQDILRERTLDGGVTMIDPSTVYLSADTEIGADVVIEPNVFFGPGVVIEDGATVHAFSHLEQTRVGSGTTVGPFARLRGGTDIGADCRIGNFVEMKNTRFADGAKASHLSYVGDSTVGEKANIGAGTITCNYDGVNKHRTEIGAGAFIGSNTALVAPVSVGSGAIVGAGSTITKNVADDDLAVTRAEQRNVAGGAAKIRQRKRKT